MARKRPWQTGKGGPNTRAGAPAYRLAREAYGELGVNADTAIRKALSIPISIHCWQADDVRGLEVQSGGDAGGLQVTGGFPGAARNGDEIRQDLEQAASLTPGPLRFNLHAMYAETDGRPVERNALTARHFRRWIDWAREQRFGLDFNPTCFAHPMMKDGLTLSSPDRKVREYWIEHCRASRRIAGSMARALGSCTNNIWVPDGFKDKPVDRWGPRDRLRESLDAVLDRPIKGVVDAVESKLFGIGCESCTVGSHEFYLTYASQAPHVALCLDLGHFHPTESIADKLSAVAPRLEHVLLHASRGVRWDSDHIVLQAPALQEVCDEAVTGGALGKMLWALDYFDASVNRIAAYVLGARALRKCLLQALLMPRGLLRDAARRGSGAEVLAIEERRKELPFGAVWDALCEQAERPQGLNWLKPVEDYAQSVLADRQ